MNKNALMITWTGFQDQEVIYPYYRLQEEGFNVDIISDCNTSTLVKGIFGIGFPTAMNHYRLIMPDSLPMPNIYSLQTEKILNSDNYSLLVLPGGVKALEKLRQQSHVLEFIRKWNENKKIIASICHGAQLLISAKIIKGRRISGYYSIKDDIENAGGIYVDDPSVIDDNIISSPHYKHMGNWMKDVIRVYNEFVDQEGH